MPAHSIPGVAFGRPRRVLLSVALLALALAAFTHAQAAGASDGAMRLAGLVWIGDQPAPAGTLLVARVGEVECGTTLVTQPTPGLNYQLTVLSATERPGCGADGAPITVLVAGTVAEVGNGWTPRFQSGSVVVDLAIP